MKIKYAAISIGLLGIWLLKLYINQDLALLILPRYNILVLLGAVVFIVGSIAMFKYRSQHWHEIDHHVKPISLGIILMVVVVEMTTTLGLTSNSVGQRGQTDLEDVVLNHTFNINIKSEDRSFGDWIHILKSKDLSKKEEGSKVNIVGFAYTDSNTDPETINLSRFLIRCCAADAQFVSIPIKTTEVHPNDQWLNVKGAIKDGKIVAETITQIPKPKIQYID